MAVSGENMPKTEQISEELAEQLRQIAFEAIAAADIGNFTVSLGATERYPESFATLYISKYAEEE